MWKNYKSHIKRKWRDYILFEFITHDLKVHVLLIR